MKPNPRIEQKRKALSEYRNFVWGEIVKLHPSKQLPQLKRALNQHIRHTWNEIQMLHSRYETES